MESLIIPTKSTPLTIPSEFSQKPISSNLSLSKTHNLFPLKTLNFAHLNHFIEIGHLNDAIAVIDKFGRNGVKLKAELFTQLLDCCIDMNSIELGRELHARVKLVDGVDAFVETKLVSMYAKCGCLSDARKVFDGMSVRNLFSWSAIIGAYAREQRWSEVVRLFGGMMEEGVVPDGFLFPKILQACGNCGDFETGRAIHSLVIRSGMRKYSRVSNSLLAMFAKCCKLSWARRFFEEMEERDIVSWNCLMYGYCQRGENGEAHRLFDLMREEGTEPSLITWNVLVTGYSQSGDCDIAMELMKKMVACGVTPDVFTWTSVISGLAQKNRIDEALELFKEMLLADFQPNGVTIASAVSACASAKSLENGKELHSVAVKMGLSENVLVGNALIDMYSKCGELEAAHNVFKLVSEKDVYTWNSMIGGYALGGYCGKAHVLFLRMQETDITPNVVTWNVMIAGYIQNGDEDQAMDLFQMMGKEGIVKPNASSWNTLISGFLQIGRKNKALGVFRQMLYSNCHPNPVTILTILPACANLIAAKQVKEIHAWAIRANLESQIAIPNSLIDIYAKSGNIAYSRSVFDWMFPKDIISWNSLIAAYVLHGRSADALDVYDQMKREGLRPNRVTFASLILAYSRAKMVEKGKQVFFSMFEDYQIIPGPEHYSSMVDLFGRSGRLKAAKEIIDTMDIEPDSTVWDALLTASRSHGNTALAIHAGEQLLSLNPGNGMAYRLVSQAYTATGRSTNSLKERFTPGNSDNSRPRGCSLLELENMVYVFVSGDSALAGLDSLYKWLTNIAVNVKLPDSSNMACLDEEGEEEISGLHSEKLALAFALLSSNCKVKCIKIVKNFRICESCHSTAKYISSNYGCEILISDTKCLHHFKSGRCSCEDYW